MPSSKPFRSSRLSTQLSASLLGLLLTLSCLLTMFWLSWHMLAQMNFAYGWGYQILDIQQHVEHYGPSNRFRHGFEKTSAAQQKRLFGEIVTAIQNGGDGLSAIRYSVNNEQIPLLRAPEVVHLQDVANLISLFNRVALGGIVLLAGLLVLYHQQRRTPPSVTQIAWGTLIIGMIVGVMLLLAGPTQLFYWLHTKVFPEGHQWFFYYQESLMTTLMKAPDLFGFIAVLWGLLGLLLFALAQWALQRLLRPSL